MFASYTTRFLNEAGIARGMKVLDVGTGAGDVALLLADLVGRRPVSVLRTERDFSVDDRSTERAFGGVGGRLDPVGVGEGPERGPDREQVVGELVVPAGAPALGAGVLEQLSEFGLDLGELSLESAAVVTSESEGGRARGRR